MAHRMQVVVVEQIVQFWGQYTGGVAGRQRPCWRVRLGRQDVQFRAEDEQVWQDEWHGWQDREW